MNGYVVFILGVLIVAAGSFICFYGTQLNSRADSKQFSTKIDNVLASIDAAKQSVAADAQQSKSAPVPAASSSSSPVASIRAAQDQLTNIDEQFSKWASNYIKDRDLKKLSLERQRLDSRAKELELSKQYRPIFQRMINAIRAAITAYKAKTGSQFKAELRDLPSNIYVTDRKAFELGTVTFTPDVKWTVGHRKTGSCGSNTLLSNRHSKCRLTMVSGSTARVAFAD